ncbi:hypothetical protein FACS1894164_21210 [Spirochaetia bacterium]|nr:hypothetical protein FACS1894164_21210 [Spirochaetia bacterium]
MNTEDVVGALIRGLNTVIKAQPEPLELLVAGILAHGHLLIEDNPGLGKTTLAKTLAHLIAGDNGESIQFKRIQFTPDLLPYDITGVDVFDPETRSFLMIPAMMLSSAMVSRKDPSVKSWSLGIFD